MNNEKRIIKASACAGVTDILFGLFMYWTGWGDFYYQHFHVFGMLGFGMLAYAYWHQYFYNLEVKKRGGV
jgi:hypothetical protein